MRVSHVQDHATHAVLGPNIAQSYGIDDNPEFYALLSDGLYSDKFLAVVREVLCNAWDAHIDAGRTDTPVQVILDDEHLIIRDFGHGISKDVIVPIYCVYGKSTKKHDGNQTGGFGLGSKAPWAYRDHFEVTSHHDGKAIIYRASKTSGEVGGRPSFVPIVTIPTDQTGIQVKIEIKHPDDVRKFSEVIHRIVAAGEMNVELNGDKLDTLPFSDAKDGYLITRKPVAATGNNHKIFVRYGNVIYPVQQEDAYRNEYKQSLELLGKLPGNSWSTQTAWQLILQAQPHTISVTPSRESLSMKDHTIETLHGLLKGFLAIRNARYVNDVKQINADCIQQSFLELAPGRMFNTAQEIVGLKAATIEDVMTEFGRVSRAIVANHYPTDSSFRASDIELRLRSLISSGYGNRGKIQTYLAAYRDTRVGYMSRRETWFHQRLVAPLVLALKTQKELTANRLLVYGNNQHSSDRQERLRYSAHTFAEATKFKKKSFEGYLPFLRNLIILAYNRNDVEERAHNFPEMVNWFGSPTDSFVYMVHRSDTKVAAAKAFFAQQGFYVLDLTKRHKQEPAHVTEPKEAREYKPRVKGIPALSGLLLDGAKWISTDQAKVPDIARIENPEFFVKCGAKNDYRHFEDLSAEASTAVVKLFGSKGGIVVNESQADKYRQQGAKPFSEWLWPKVLNELKTNQRLRKYWSLDHRREIGLTGPYRLSYENQLLIDVIVGDDVLATYYDITTTITDEDRQYITLWSYWYSKNFRSYSPTAEYNAMAKFFTDLPVSPNLAALIFAVNNSQLRSMISASDLQTLLAEAGTNPEINMKKTRARDLLIYVLKG